MNVEAIIRAIAPDDIDAKPIYLVDAADLGLAMTDTLAFTNRSCDLMLRPFLESTGRWRGRGFACVIDRQVLDPVQRIGVVLHELAHWLDTGDQPDHPVMSRRQPAAAMELSDAIVGSLTIPAWFGHEERFVRAAAHLAYRVAGLIEAVRPRHLRFIGPYHREPFSEAVFMDALSDELTRSDSIRSVLDTAAPEAFVERWEMATG